MKFTPDQWTALDKAFSEAKCTIVITDKGCLIQGEKTDIHSAIRAAIQNDFVFGNIVGSAHHLLAADIYNDQQKAHTEEDKSGGGNGKA